MANKKNTKKTTVSKVKKTAKKAVKSVKPEIKSLWQRFKGWVLSLVS